MYTCTPDMHITPLLKILVTGLIQIVLLACTSYCVHCTHTFVSLKQISGHTSVYHTCNSYPIEIEIVQLHCMHVLAIMLKNFHSAYLVECGLKSLCMHSRIF